MNDTFLSFKNSRYSVILRKETFIRHITNDNLSIIAFLLTTIRIIHRFFLTLPHKTTHVEYIKTIRMKRLLLFYFCMCHCILGMLADIQNTQGINNMGIQQGLSNGFVTDIALDNQGFLWAATESGLNRIAGNKCTVFKCSNSNMPDDAIVGLYFDKQHNQLWIHYKNGNMNVFDCKTQQFISIHLDKNIANRSIADINEAADGGIWIACYDGTIAHYNHDSQTFKTISKQHFPQAKHGVRSITDDGKDHLYIGLCSEGLIEYNLRTGKTRHFAHQANDETSLPGNNVRSVFIDHMQNVWIGTNLGLGLYNPGKGRFRTFRHTTNSESTLAGDNIHNINELRDNKLLISSDLGGISILDLNIYANPSYGDVKFERQTKEDGNLSSNNIRKVLQDDFGNLWIDNYSSGVDFIPSIPSYFNIVNLMGKKLENANSLFAANNGSLWFGLDDNICEYRNGSIMQMWNFSSYLSNSSASVYVIQMDKQGILWLGTSDNGVIKFNPQNHQFSRINCAQELDVHSLYADPSGKMWIGSEYGLYSVDVNGKEQKEDALNKQMGWNPVIYSLNMDYMGRLWIGTMTNGVYIFDKQQRLVAHLDSKHLLPSNSINHIFKDNDGSMWIGTFKGLAYIANPQKLKDIRLYDERQGIKDSHIRAITQDQQGNIWVSMFSGIACFDSHKQKFFNYNYADGIPTGNFVEGAAVTSTEGFLYFGSPGGVCYFNPQLLTEKKTISSVEIIGCERVFSPSEGFETSAISPDEDGNIQLKYNDNTFKIAFTVKDYAQEGSTEYSYMMKGLDDKWYETEDDNEVTFRNLAPGDYTFIIRAKLKNQDWSEASTAEMKVCVNPPLWLTWWAKLGYFLLAMGLLAYFFRSYQKELLLRNSLAQAKWESQQKQELNEERLRFFTNITHELRTPITLILGPLEDIMEDKRLPEIFSKKVASIHASAERLLNLINDILEFRKTETQNRRLTVARADLGALVKEIGIRFKDLNHNPKVEVKVEVQPDVPAIYFDSEVINTVINNLMSNALKYTPEGKVTLSLYQQNDEVVIVIEDTGYGIDKDSLPHIFDRYYQANGKHQASGTGIGLALVKSLAHLHQAELKTESEKGIGSKFSFILKMDETYPQALHKDDEPKDMASTAPIYNKVEEESEDQRPLLLIVEDNADIRLYIDESLHEDYRILQASNGKEACQLAFEQIPDIIVSDIMMPEMDGIEMTKILKDDLRTSHVPIILLTAKTSMNDQEEGYDSGADSYLTKPFSTKLLNSRIRNLLSSRRRLAELIAQRNMPTLSQAEGSQENAEAMMPEQEPLVELSPLDKKFLEKLDALIENHISTDDLDMAFMTDKMAMSNSTFYRKMKALTGMGPNEYIKKAKLRKSMELLRTKEYSVNEVAMMTGFNNIGNFRVSFKREFGKTPSEILKE